MTCGECPMSFLGSLLSSRCVNSSWGEVSKCLLIPNRAPIADQIQVHYKNPIWWVNEFSGSTYSEHVWRLTYRSVCDPERATLAYSLAPAWITTSFWLAAESLLFQSTFHGLYSFCILSPPKITRPHTTRAALYRGRRGCNVRWGSTLDPLLWGNVK